MSFADKKGITVASGFKLQAGALLDARGQVDTMADRDELVTVNAVTEGLQVYVKATKVAYVWNGSGWDELSKGSGYVHPTGDGYKHVPATGTGSNGKILQAGATAGAMSWAAPSKSMVGLSNVDNTSDASKPVSTAQQTALNGKANASHTHGNADITSVDASKITSGTIGIDRLPKAALERCVLVADDTARFKLTSAAVQQGDTVKVISTKLMYFVKDETKLSSEEGYEIYTAGSASSVPWAGVTGKPTTFPPAAHSHDDKYYTEAEMNTKLGAKVDKVTGKGLSANDFTNADKTKLDGVAAEANKYVHPSTHAASVITQDATHRFVSDSEKAKWNAAKPEIFFASELPETAPSGSICFLI